MPRWFAPTGLLYVLCLGSGCLAWYAGIPARWMFAIWPPAGFALAGLSIWGLRAAPGIFAGIATTLFIQTKTFNGDRFSDGYYLLSACAFAGISTLQACVGSALLRRFCGEQTRLIQPTVIFRFLLIAGPIQALFSTLLAPPVIMLLGRWNGDNYLLYSLDFMLNEVLGGVAFSVVLFSFARCTDAVWRSRQLTVTMPILVCVVFFWLLDDIAPGKELRLSQLALRAVELVVCAFVLLLIALLLLVSGHAATVRDEANRVTEDLFNETSARLFAQTSLITSEARLAEAQNIARIGSWVWDPVIDVSDWSDELFRLLGYAPRSFEPTHARFIECVHPDDRSLVAERMRAAVANEQPYQFDFRVVLPTGEIRIFHVDAIIDRDAAGLPIRWRGTDQDVTDRVRAEEDRRRLDDRLRSTQRWESLGQLAGGIAHDFNNLMGGVLGYATLAREQLPPDAPTQELLKPIEDAAQHAASLCQQLLTFAGKGSSANGALDIPALVAESAELIRMAVPRAVEVRINASRDLPIVEGDRSQLKQVLLNLVWNAADAIGPAGGVIEIRTGACRDTGCPTQSPGHYCGTLLPGTYVWLEVGDTGCGIPPESLPRIFDPFFTTKDIGRGLGLSAVAGIVRSHGGVACVTSRPGVGTTVRVTLAALADESINHTPPLGITTPREIPHPSPRPLIEAMSVASG